MYSQTVSISQVSSMDASNVVLQATCITPARGILQLASLRGYIREALGVAYLWALRSLCCLSQSLSPPPLSQSTARQTPWLSRPCQHARLFPSPFCTHPRSQSHVRPIYSACDVTSTRTVPRDHFIFVYTCIPRNYVKSTHLHVHVYNRHSTLLYAREGNTCMCGNHINDQCNVQQLAWQDSGMWHTQYTVQVIYSKQHPSPVPRQHGNEASDD